MAYTDREDLNYLGILYLIGNTRTPFLNMIGGLNGGKISTSFQFPLGQYYSLDAASQDTQSEATSATEGTPKTYTRSQAYNVCQIMKKDAEASFAKLSETGKISGLAIAGQQQPVQDELTFQKNAAFYQLALDIEYSFLQGTFVDSSLATTNQTTRGIIEAISTNAVAAGGADFTSDHLNELLRTMVGNGAEFRNPVIFVNAFNKQKISENYGYAPMDRMVGGINIKQIETDFATLGVVYCPNVTAGTLIVIDLAFCYPVYVPIINVPGIPNGQLIAWVPKAEVAAKVGGYWYTQVGLDYAHEKYHGKITGLSTS